MDWRSAFWLRRLTATRAVLPADRWRACLDIKMNREPNHRDQPHDQYRQRSPPVVIKKNPHTWFVSIHVPQQKNTGHYSRRSRTFTSESEAKQFAAARIAAGAEVSAGTLNPFAPKRIVGPSEIESWLAEQTNRPAS
jgi:hypothetical protein